MLHWATDHEPRERTGVAVAGVAMVRPPLHVHFEVIPQVPSHPEELMGDRDSMVAQVFPRVRHQRECLVGENRRRRCHSTHRSAAEFYSVRYM